MEQKVKREKKPGGSVHYTYKDVTAIISPYQGGRMSYGYGHWGYEYNQVLYILKGEKRIINKSYRDVYISYVKALVIALAEEPTECPYCHRPSLFYGKQWTHGVHIKNTKSFKCERCHRPRYEFNRKGNDFDSYYESAQWQEVHGFIH